MFWRQIIKHFRDEARILYNFSPSDFAVFPKSLKNRPLPRLKKKNEKNPGGVITRDGSGWKVGKVKWWRGTTQMP